MDNPLKAIVDAIAEEDNDIGGQLLTRLVQKGRWGRNDAYLETANPTRISVPTGAGWFESWMVGVEIDIIVEATFKGRYSVLTVDSSGDYCTVEILGGGVPSFTDTDPIQIRMGELIVESTYQFLDPATHVTDDQGSLWVGNEPERVIYAARQLVVGDMRFQQLGNVDTGDGYLTLDHKPLTVITEGSQSYSALDKLRRALLVDYATEEELDRVARNLAVVRPVGMSDAIFREVIKALAYLPKGTFYGLELLLDALFPAGGWSVYEDLVNANNTVFILLPVMEPGQDPEGRTFISSEEPQASTSTITVDVDHTPISVASIILDDIDLVLDMTVLPSADPTPWAYQNEGDVEGSIFSIVSGRLQHVQGPGDALGGRYQRSIPDLGVAFPPGSYGSQDVLWAFEIDQIIDVFGSAATIPWMMVVTDGTYEFGLGWTSTGISLVQSDGTPVVGGGSAPGVGVWHRFQLRRRGDLIEGLMDGKLELQANVSAFAAAVTTWASFGYWNNAGNQDWTVRWDNAACRVTTRWRNWWNLFSQTGALSVSDSDLDDGSNPFMAGDEGRYIRVYDPVNNENDGLWLASYVGAGTVTLDGVPLERARVLTPDPSKPEESLVILEEDWFRPNDVGKEINISGSGLGNDGDYPVVAWGSSIFVVVDASVLASGFVAESLLTWKFNPDFVTAASVNYEIIDAGSVAGETLTARQAWPTSGQEVTVDYTAVLSAQLMRNETIENEGSGGAEPNIFYPFYLWDVEQSIRDLMDAVTAAGVIPEFERDF